MSLGKKSKISFLYDTVSKDISTQVSADVKSHSEKCAAQIKNELRNSSAAVRKEILEYLQQDHIPADTPENAKQIIALQEKIDEEEMKKSALVSNYHTSIRIFLFIALCFMFFLQYFSALKVSSLPPADEASFPDSELFQNLLQNLQNVVVNNGLFVQNLFFGCTLYSIALCVIAPFYYHFRDRAIAKAKAAGKGKNAEKKKGNRFVVFIKRLIIISPFLIFAFIAFITPYQKYGVINLECYALCLSFGVFYNETKRLNKADSYNIMVLILTLVSLAIGLYSLNK